MSSITKTTNPTISDDAFYDLAYLHNNDTIGRFSPRLKVNPRTEYSKNMNKYISKDYIDPHRGYHSPPHNMVYYVPHESKLGRHLESKEFVRRAGGISVPPPSPPVILNNFPEWILGDNLESEEFICRRGKKYRTLRGCIIKLGKPNNINYNAPSHNSIDKAVSPSYEGCADRFEISAPRSHSHMNPYLQDSRYVMDIPRPLSPSSILRGGHTHHHTETHETSRGPHGEVQEIDTTEDYSDEDDDQQKKSDDFERSNLIRNSSGASYGSRAASVALDIPKLRVNNTSLKGPMNNTSGWCIPPTPRPKLRGRHKHSETHETSRGPHGEQNEIITTEDYSDADDNLPDNSDFEPSILIGNTSDKSYGSRALSFDLGRPRIRINTNNASLQSPMNNTSGFQIPPTPKPILRGGHKHTETHETSRGPHGELQEIITTEDYSDAVNSDFEPSNLIGNFSDGSRAASFDLGRSKQRINTHNASLQGPMNTSALPKPSSPKSKLRGGHKHIEIHETSRGPHGELKEIISTEDVDEDASAPFYGGHVASFESGVNKPRINMNNASLRSRLNTNGSVPPKPKSHGGHQHHHTETRETSRGPHGAVQETVTTEDSDYSDASSDDVDIQSIKSEDFNEAAVLKYHHLLTLQGREMKSLINELEEERDECTDESMKEELQYKHEGLINGMQTMFMEIREKLRRKFARECIRLKQKSEGHVADVNKSIPGTSTSRSDIYDLDGIQVGNDIAQIKQIMLPIVSLIGEQAASEKELTVLLRTQAKQTGGNMNESKRYLEDFQKRAKEEMAQKLSKIESLVVQHAEEMDPTPPKEKSIVKTKEVHGNKSNTTVSKSETISEYHKYLQTRRTELNAIVEKWMSLGDDFQRVKHHDNQRASYYPSEETQLRDKNIIDNRAAVEEEMQRHMEETARMSKLIKDANEDRTRAASFDLGRPRPRVNAHNASLQGPMNTSGLPKPPSPKPKLRGGHKHTEIHETSRGPHGELKEIISTEDVDEDVPAPFYGSHATTFGSGATKPRINMKNTSLPSRLNTNGSVPPRPNSHGGHQHHHTETRKTSKGPYGEIQETVTTEDSDYSDASSDDVDIQSIKSEDFNDAAVLKYHHLLTLQSREMKSLINELEEERDECTDELMKEELQYKHEGLINGMQTMFMEIREKLRRKFARECIRLKQKSAGHVADVNKSIPGTSTSRSDIYDLDGIQVGSDIAQIKQIMLPIVSLIGEQAACEKELTDLLETQAKQTGGNMNESKRYLEDFQKKAKEEMAQKLSKIESLVAKHAEEMDPTPPKQKSIVKTKEVQGNKSNTMVSVSETISEYHEYLQRRRNELNAIVEKWMSLDKNISNNRAAIEEEMQRHMEETARMLKLIKDADGDRTRAASFDLGRHRPRINTHNASLQGPMNTSGLPKPPSPKPKLHGGHKHIEIHETSRGPHGELKEIISTEDVDEDAPAPFYGGHAATFESVATKPRINMHNASLPSRLNTNGSVPSNPNSNGGHQHHHTETRKTSRGPHGELKEIISTEDVDEDVPAPFYGGHAATFQSGAAKPRVNMKNVSLPSRLNTIGSVPPKQNKSQGGHHHTEIHETSRGPHGEIKEIITTKDSDYNDAIPIKSNNLVPKITMGDKRAQWAKAENAKFKDEREKRRGILLQKHKDQLANRPMTPELTKQHANELEILERQEKINFATFLANLAKVMNTEDIGQMSSKKDSSKSMFCNWRFKLVTFPLPPFNDIVEAFAA